MDIRYLFLFIVAVSFSASVLADRAEMPLEHLNLGNRPYLTVTPEPVEVHYSDRVVPIAGYSIIGGEAGLESLVKKQFGALFKSERQEGKGSALKIICTLKGKEQAADKLKTEGYDLKVNVAAGEVTATISAITGRGLAYGLMSLRQLLIERNGQLWIRPASIRDEPTIPQRLVKRSLPFWLDQALLYKLNGGVVTASVGEDGSIAGREASFRRMVELGKERFLGMQAMVSMGNIYRGGEAYQRRVVAGFRSFVDYGFSSVAVMNDDKMTLLDREGKERYPSYVAAQLDYMQKIAKAVREANPATPIAFMPNFYYGEEVHPPYARELRGKLPDNVALFWAGPGIPGPDLKLEELRKVASDTGVRKLWFYTNWPQCGGPYWAENLGPIRNHEVGKGDLLELVTISTSTQPEALPISFITLCDLLWNPESYNPERSLRTATKELVDPESYDAFLALFEFMDRNAPIASISEFHPMYAANEPAQRRAMIETRSAALEPLLAACLATPAGSSEGAIRVLLQRISGKRAEYLERLAKAEAEEERPRIVRTISCPLIEQDVAVNGGIDETTWRKAAADGGFTDLSGSKPAPHQTSFQVLRTNEAIYLRIRCEEPHLDDPAMVKTGEPSVIPFSPQPASFLWWADAVEIFLDPGRDGRQVYQVIVNPWGLVECLTYSLNGYGYYNITSKKRHAWKIAGRATWKRDAIEYEVCLPLTIFEDVPRGTWGFNIGRTRIIKAGDGIKYTSWSPLTWGFQDAKRFGKMIFE
jgi:hypothetical protein